LCVWERERCGEKSRVLDSFLVKLERESVREEEIKKRESVCEIDRYAWQSILVELEKVNDCVCKLFLCVCVCVCACACACVCVLVNVIVFMER